MEHKYLDKIKNLEGPPKKVNIFSKNEIQMIQELYNNLPERTYNKQQKVRKKTWEQNFNKELDKIYFSKLKEALGDFKMDNLKSKSGEDYYGLFHESFGPLPIHVDSGFQENDIIYKQVITPLAPVGDTIFFKKRWYGRSTSFTIDPEELKFKPKEDQNDRSNQHIGNIEFDKEMHKKYLSHIDINNLKGMEIEFIYEWKLGETLIVDRTHIHCASTRINTKKLGLTTFTKK
jgi:hypothetical protein